MLGIWNILKNVQAHIIILHQHVSGNPVTIIGVAYDKNTINVTNNCTKMYDKKPLGVTFDVQIKCKSHIF